MKIVFVDRDGVLNKFPGKEKYVVSLKEFELLPNTSKAIKHFTSAGYEVNVISNQGCVSKGLLSPQDLKQMTDILLKAIEKEGGKIQGVYYCLHQTSDQCECRKPKTKMFHDALKGRKVDVSQIYFVGDSKEDMMAGKAMGFKTLLVLSGRTQKEDLGAFEPKPDVIKNDLLEAALWITKNF